MTVAAVFQKDPITSKAGLDTRFLRFSDVGRPANANATACMESTLKNKPKIVSAFNPSFVRVRSLCGRPMRMSALALDLPSDWSDRCYSQPALTLRFVNYHDQRVEPAHGQLRYSAHHDDGGLTILRQDDAHGGLEACDREGRLARRGRHQAQLREQRSSAARLRAPRRARGYSS